ncbi:MAG: esterase/lipase family protein [Cellulomonadaceae bacterium]
MIPSARTPRGLLARWAAWTADYAYITRRQAGALLRPLDAGRYARGARTPVLLVPGIYETGAFLAPVAAVLHGAGFGVHTVPTLGYNGRDLRASADLVAARITELGLDRVILVAHSKGGLIGKRVMGLPGGDRVVGMVAVNTPFGGSVYATWFPARSVRALSPRHPDMVALGRESVPHPRIVSLFASFDPHVPSGSELAGAVNERLPLMGHFRVVAMPAMQQAVLRHVAALDAVAHRSAPSPATPDVG